MIVIKVCAAVVFFMVLSACEGPIDEVPPQPIGPTYIWMMPRRTTFEELLTNIDQWQETLELVDVIGYADHDLNRLYSDAVLSHGFAVLNDIGLPLALEVGAIKEWSVTGAGTFAIQRQTWDKLIGLGATIVGIVLDEPLVAVHAHSQFNFVGDAEAKFEYAVEETAEFIRLVRENYPHWFVADIEVYPHFTADYVIRWIDALEARLRAKGVRGQEFFRMDVDWNAFRPRNQYMQHWEEVRRIEDHCRSIGLPFSQIYWAANIPRDPGGWLDAILEMGQRYQDAGGMPDQYVIQSWLNNEEIPEKTLPETDPESFTYSVLEFRKQFIPDREELDEE